MIKHIVLFKFKPMISEDEIASVFQELGKLQIAISQIRSYTWGKYSSNEGLNKGFNYCFVMEFASATDRDHYLAHPEHERVKNAIVLPALQDELNSVLAFDFVPQQLTLTPKITVFGNR